MPQLLTSFATPFVRTGTLVADFADGAKRTFGSGAPPARVRHPEPAVGDLSMDGRWVMREGNLADVSPSA